MRSTSGYASIWCIVFHQLQPKDLMASTSRGLLNARMFLICKRVNYFLSDKKS